jgi:hypothetical protein
MPNGLRGSFQGYSSRASGELPRQLMTHRFTLWPSIAALRKAHSITSSARASNVGGTVGRSAFAVPRLMTI